MLLAIDIGNTNIVVGVFDAERLSHSWRLSTQRQRTADEMGMFVLQLFQHGQLAPADISAVVLASVVPTLTRPTAEMARRYFHREALVVDGSTNTGMPLLVDEPGQVGADRIVNGVAAHARHGRADSGSARDLIVVDFGTATTFDAISARGEYAGRRHLPRREHLGRCAVRTGGAAAARGCSKAGGRHRSDDRCPDALGLVLRLRGPGRRDRRPDAPGARWARRVHRDRGPRRDDRARHAGHRRSRPGSHAARPAHHLGSEQEGVRVVDADAYCREIEAHLCRRNAGHLVRVAGPAFEMVAGWAAQGIPLKVALNGIDRAVDRRDAKGPSRRPLRVEFCEADVLDAFDAWRRAVGVGTAGGGGLGQEAAADSAADEPRQRSGPSLRAHLDRVVTRLTDCLASGVGGGDLERAIDRAVAELGEARAASRGLRGDARAALITRLHGVDDELMAAARAATSPERTGGARARGEAGPCRVPRPHVGRRLRPRGRGRNGETAPGAGEAAGNHVRVVVGSQQ